MALLELHDICSGYGDVQILWGANMAIQQGQLTALVGANGSGKTTFLRSLMGLIRPPRTKSSSTERISPPAGA